MGQQEHMNRGATIRAAIAVMTLSDTRTRETDTSGQFVIDAIAKAGHLLASYELIADEPAELQRIMMQWADDAKIDCIITNGGTGVARRDVTIDVIEKMIDVPLPGFGELFRMLSFEQIGASAMLSRAIGGIIRGKVVFALPGSTKAVQLGMEKLILPQVGHLIGELRKIQPSNETRRQR